MCNKDSYNAPPATRKRLSTSPKTFPLGKVSKLTASPLLHITSSQLPWMLLKRGMGNEEWGMGNGE